MTTTDDIALDDIALDDIALTSADLRHPFTRLSAFLHAEGLPFPNIDRPVTVPQGDSPTLVCHRCAKLWALGVVRARESGVHQGRAIVCPCGDRTGSTVNVAFIAHSEGSEPEWLEIAGVPCGRWNELYLSLVFDGGARYVEAASAALNLATNAGLHEIALRRHSRNAHIAGALVLALMENRL